MVSANGQDSIGPWPSVARALRFNDAQASLFSREFPSTFVQNSAFVAISAGGLASVCAAHGHALQLMEMLNEDSTYSCPLRSFARLLSAPKAQPEWSPLSRVHTFTGSGHVWFDEGAILELFGQQTRARPSAFVQNIIGGLGQMSDLRAFGDPQTHTLIPGAKNASPSRVPVLSAAAASALFRHLLSNAVSQPCPMRDAIGTASARLIAEAKRAQQQPQRQPPDHMLELATCVFYLAARVLAALSPEQCLSLAPTASLCALSSQLGAALRLRNAQIASEAVKNGDRELSLSALAQYENEAYIRARGEPVFLAFLRALLGCGQVQAERGDRSRRRNVFSGLENLAATQRAEAARTNGLITTIDVALKSTNTAFVSPRAYIVASDMLTVTGAALLVVVGTQRCMCARVVCRQFARCRRVFQARRRRAHRQRVAQRHQALPASSARAAAAAAAAACHVSAQRHRLQGQH